ncbi:hypothetical protein IWZ03DRAFT_361157 [Phyllosticta citriasiana]|uniref:Uncharacterized protein n=1 Tax=Phyllosticta citriasiana TaxID=595635 RepID=A0ABR1KKB5_9PEZI
MRPNGHQHNGPARGKGPSSHPICLLLLPRCGIAPVKYPWRNSSTSFRDRYLAAGASVPSLGFILISTSNVTRLVGSKPAEDSRRRKNFLERNVTVWGSWQGWHSWCGGRLRDVAVPSFAIRRKRRGTDDGAEDVQGLRCRFRAASCSPFGQHQDPDKSTKVVRSRVQLVKRNVMSVSEAVSENDEDKRQGSMKGHQTARNQEASEGKHVRQQPEAL